MKFEPRASIDPPVRAEGISRRKDIRLDAPSGLRISVPPITHPIVVENISLGGLGIASDTPFALESVHTVTLTSGRMTVTRRAMTVHCRRHEQGGWRMGMTFLADPPGRGSTIEQLINHLLASSISFTY